MYLYILPDGQIYQSENAPIPDELSAIDEEDIRIVSIQGGSFTELTSDPLGLETIRIPTRDEI